MIAWVLESVRRRKIKQTADILNILRGEILVSIGGPTSQDLGRRHKKLHGTTRKSKGTATIGENQTMRGRKKRSKPCKVGTEASR